MTLRQATRADLDGLRDVALAAFPQDPQWDYRFPLRHEYPLDTAYWTRRQYEAYFDAKESVFETLVITVAIEGDDCHAPHEKLVAMAVWEVTYVPKGGEERNGKDRIRSMKEPQDGRCCRRDANVAHMSAFMDAMLPAKKQYFDHVYGRRQLHLQILATHPDFQRRGFGSRLCKWGLDLAQKYSFYATVFGSPMGKDLYSYLKFKDIGELTVRVKGEEEKLTIAIMVWEPSISDDYILVSRPRLLSSGEMET